jgi:hypothetical protein
MVRVQIHAVRIEGDRDLRALPSQRRNQGAPNLIGRRRCEHLILIREDFEMLNAEDLRGIPDLSFADMRQIVARTNVGGFAALAPRGADDADLHAHSRVPGDRAAGDECFVVRMSQKEEQARHGSSFTGGIVREKLSSP